MFVISNKKKLLRVAGCVCVFSAGVSGCSFFSPVLRYLQSVLYIAHKNAKQSFPPDVPHKLVKKTLLPHEQPTPPLCSYGL